MDKYDLINKIEEKIKEREECFYDIVDVSVLESEKKDFIEFVKIYKPLSYKTAIYNISELEDLDIEELLYLFTGNKRQISCELAYGKLDDEYDAADEYDNRAEELFSEYLVINKKIHLFKIF
jgi:hypothetical protein